MALKVGELFASFDLDSSGMNATMRTIENSMEAMGANMVSLGSSLQASLTAPIESFAKQTLSAGMDFTSQMSTVEAISGATAEEMDRLNAEALKMGSTTQFIRRRRIAAASFECTRYIKQGAATTARRTSMSDSSGCRRKRSISD